MVKGTSSSIIAYRDMLLNMSIFGGVVFLKNLCCQLFCKS